MADSDTIRWFEELWDNLCLNHMGRFLQANLEKMNEKKNVIVLTNGLTGSSVVAGLLARSGYWLGEEVVSKPDYNTFENSELVRLNQQLFDEAGYRGNYGMVFNPEDPHIFERCVNTIDPRPYQAFIAKCTEHGPWLWKDPRLWLTIHFWAPLLDLDNIKFVVLTREPLQTWISTTNRRQIHTPRFCRETMHGIRDSITGLLTRSDLPFLELVYEDLIVDTDVTISKINDFLEIQLTRDDLVTVFRGELGKRQLGISDFVKASLIYLKNYSQRYK